MWFKTLHQLVSSQILFVSSGSRCVIYRRLDYVSIRFHNCYFPLRFARKSTTFLRHTQIFVLKNAKYFSCNKKNRTYALTDMRFFTTNRSTIPGLKRRPSLCASAHFPVREEDSPHPSSASIRYSPSSLPLRESYILSFP